MFHLFSVFPVADLVAISNDHSSISATIRQKSENIDTLDYNLLSAVFDKRPVITMIVYDVWKGIYLKKDRFRASSTESIRNLPSVKES